MNNPQLLTEIQIKALKLFSSLQCRPLIDELYSCSGSAATVSSVIDLLRAEDSSGASRSTRVTQFVVDIIRREINDDNHQYPRPAVVTFLEKLTSTGEVVRSDIHTELRKFSQNIPLRLLFTLSKTGITSTMLYLQHCVEVKSKAAAFVKELVSVATGGGTENFELILHFLSTLIQVAYSDAFPELPLLTPSNQKILTKMANVMLDTVTRKIWEALNADASLEVRLYGLVARFDREMLRLETLQNACTQQLVFLMGYKPDIKLAAAISNQSQWTILKTPPNVVNFFQELMLPLNCDQLITEIDNVLTTSEVNWKTVLVVTSAINLFYMEGNRSIRSLGNNLLQKAFDRLQMDLSVAALLLVRQVTLNGECSTTSYSQWFSSTFGSSQSIANTDPCFAFLVKLLSSIVPYETAAALKAHLSSPPFIPPGERCRELWRDYVTLSRTRLNDLAPSMEEDSAKDDKDQDELKRVESEIELHISSFERTGHLPNTLLETAIFRRSYFSRTYLPALLKPRILPDSPDPRLRFIQALKTAGKLSTAAYEEHRQKCVAYAEKLIGGILTEDIMEWEESTDPLERLRQLLKKTEDDWLSRNEVPNCTVFGEIAKCLEELIPDHTEDDSPLDLDEEQRNEARIKDHVAFQILQTLFDTVTRSAVPYGRNGPPQWIRQFLLILADHRRLIRALYCELWDKIQSFNVQDNLIQTFGLILSVIYQSEASFPLAKCESTVARFTPLLIQFLPIRTSGQQHFLVRLLHAVIRPGIKAGTLEHTPDAAVVKLYKWVGGRLEFLGRSDLSSTYLEYLGMAEFQMNEFQMSLEEFLQRETSINSSEDLFHWSERIPYLSSVLESGQFSEPLDKTPFQDVPEADGLNLRLLHYLLQFTQNKKGNTPDCCQDILMILQSRLLDPTPSRTVQSPWLLRYWGNLHENPLSGIVKDTLDVSLWNLVKCLPPYLLTRNSPGGSVQPDLLDELCEGSWRNSMTDGAWLPQCVVSHIFQTLEFNQMAACLKFSVLIHGLKIPKIDPDWQDLSQAVSVFNPRVLQESSTGIISWSGRLNIDILVGHLIVIAVYCKLLRDGNLDSFPWYARQLAETARTCPGLMKSWDLQTWSRGSLPWNKILPDSFFKLLPFVHLSALIAFESLFNQTESLKNQFLELLLKAHADWVNAASISLKDNTPVDYPSGKILDLLTLGKLTAIVKRILSRSPADNLKSLRSSPVFQAADDDFKRLVFSKCI